MRQTARQVKGESRFPTEWKRTHGTKISKRCCEIKLQRSQDVRKTVIIKETRGRYQRRHLSKNKARGNEARAVRGQATTGKNFRKLDEQAQRRES